MQRLGRLSLGKTATLLGHALTGFPLQRLF